MRSDTKNKTFFKPESKATYNAEDYTPLQRFLI